MRSSISNYLYTATNLVLAFALISGSQAHARTLLDGIAATVDGEPILVSTIRTKVKKGPLVTLSDYPVGPGSPTWTRAMQDEVNKQLMIQSAGEFGVSIDASQVEPEIEKFIARQNSAAKAGGGEQMTVATLKTLLKQENKSWQVYKREFAEQMLLQEFQKRALLPTIKATDRDLRTFYRQVGGTEGRKSQTIDALRIVVDSQTKAESLHKKLKKGEDFLTLAKKHSTSEDPTKVIKGLDLNDLPDAMKVKLQGLAEGDISEPVAASGGLYFLFKVQSRKVKEGSGGEFERIKPRLTQEYKSKELVSATHTWLEENRKNSNIKIIVKTKS